MFDNLNDLIIIVNNSLERKYLSNININWNKIIPWFIILFTVLASGISLQINYFKNKVKTRRILFTLALFIIISVLLALIEDHNIVFAVCYLAVPVSIIMANYFINSKLAIMKEILFFALIIAAILYQYII
jgi:hypothetical protein